VIVVIIGRNSGVSPTARATTNSSDFEGVAVEDDTDDQEEQDQEDNGLHDQEPKLPGSTGKLGLRWACGQARGNIPEGGVSPDRLDDRCASATHYRGAKEYPAGAPGAGRRLGCLARLLFDRQRLAGECGLLNMQVSCLQQARIRGDQIPGGQPDDISGHQFPPRDLDPDPIPEDHRRGGHALSKPLHRPLGSMGLHEIEHYTEQHQRDDDAGVHPFAQEGRGQGGDQQDDHQGIEEEGQDLDQRGSGVRRCRFIGAKLGQALPCQAAR
jgi:hypothetical protein